MICKEVGCMTRVSMVANKDYDSQVYRIRVNGRDILAALYPSHRARHGYCDYHYREKYYGNFHKEVMRMRKKTNKNAHMKFQPLIRMGGRDEGKPQLGNIFR